MKLAAIQRVVRAQRFEGPEALTHFGIFGLVTAGRGPGDHTFERQVVAEQVRVLVGGILAAGPDAVTVRLSDWSGRLASVSDEVRRVLSGRPEATVVDDPDRTRARGCYDGLALQIDAVVDGQPVEVADGGLVDWSGRLLGSAKERLLITGVGVDRLTALVPSA